MKIEHSLVYLVDYNGKDYIRLSSDNWMCWYGSSLEYIPYTEELETEFQKKLKQDFDNDKYA